MNERPVDKKFHQQIIVLKACILIVLGEVEDNFVVFVNSHILAMATHKFWAFFTLYREKVTEVSLCL